MKVSDSTLSQTAASRLGKAHESEGVAGGARKDSAGRLQDGDQVQLSNLSGRLLEMLRADSADRTARIERLAADYKAGRYQADPVEVSRGIIGDAMRM
jgi:anti-sigma28 factor (negative regulator of flagellin synthesis)